MEIDQREYSSLQLREWCKRLNLRTSGTKAELALRLSQVPVGDRGPAPKESELRPQDIVSESEDENSEVIEIELKRREVELLKREKKLLERENELLIRMSRMNVQQETNIAATSVRSAEPTLPLVSNTQVSNNSPVTRNVEPSVPITMIKEMIPEFNGDGSVEFWVRQARSIGEAYELNENMMRAIISTKVSGKALKWLHNNTELATLSINQLFAQMQEFFGTKENKLTLRRRFEARLWKSGEPFIDYFADKIALAETLQIEEDEIVDYVIDGIPNEQLKVQAYMQRFNSRKELLQAFLKVQLKPDRRQFSQQPQQQQKFAPKPIRCFNCNSLGHFAPECRKPKRDYNACYGCGSLEHKVMECPERKVPVSMVEMEEYVRTCKFIFLNYNINSELLLVTLIDTGSPISFVKESCLTFKNELNSCSNNFSNVNFYGLNKSKLQVLGSLTCFVVIENCKIPLNLFVVAEGTMSVDVILGRDFLKKSDAKLKINPTNDSEKNNVTKKIDSNKEKSGINTENFVKEHNQGHSVQRGNSTTFFTNETFQIETCAIEANIVVGNAVKWDDKNRLINLFNEKYVNAIRPEVPETECKMQIKLDSNKTFNCRPRRLSYSEKQELQKIIDEYLSKNYIRPSQSEFSSAIVLVKKKTGELRMCIDFRNLNKVTVKDNYPIPLIDDLLDRLANKKIFTKLDLKDGFFHVFMHCDSIKYTAFVTPLGQFEFLRMPFGLKNAPAMFQRFVNMVFAEMIRSGDIIIYLDDIMIATNSVDEHINILEKVFKKLVQNRLKLRVDKCEFMQTHIKFLGYEITGEGIKADEKGIQAIKNFPTPTTQHAGQSFLGLCSYFRRFVKKISTMAKPLHDLTKKNCTFKFGQIEIECFELLKKKLIESPVLALYNPTSETELHCDASTLGFGAILLQKQNDKKFHPVFYFSKRTTATEEKYHSFELETLAIIYALKRFRIYLQGKSFKIVTDCNSLKLTLDKKEINPRIARWAMELQNFDFSLEHRTNDKMKHVDALSRHTNILVIEENTFEDNLVICQNRDEKIKRIKSQLEKSESSAYEMRNETLYRKRDRQIFFYVPESMENKVIAKYHDEMGHVGINKTTELISKTYWFPKLKEKVSEYIKNCLKCIIFSSKQGPEEGFIHKVPKSITPFEVIHIDHYGPVDDRVKIKKYILVVIDACTKFVRLYCTKTTNTKEVITSLTDYFRAYSRPRCVVSDRGSCFTSGEFKEFLQKHNIKHVKVATASPQANGQVERVNRSIGPMLAKITNREQGIQWYAAAEIVEFCLNNTIHRSIGQHPSVMLFGINQRGNDVLKENLIEIKSSFKRANLKKIRKVAHLKQKQLQSYNKSHADKKRRKATKYRTGDYVMIKNLNSLAIGPRKLIPKYKGPYKIEKILRKDRFLLKDVDGFQVSQTPYVGVWSAANMRPWIGNKRITRITRKK